MGEVGTNRKSPNDAPWESLDGLAGQFLQTPEASQDRKEEEVDE